MENLVYKFTDDKLGIVGVVTFIPNEGGEYTPAGKIHCVYTRTDSVGQCSEILHEFTMVDRADGKYASSAQLPSWDKESGEFMRYVEGVVFDLLGISGVAWQRTADDIGCARIKLRKEGDDLKTITVTGYYGNDQWPAWTVTRRALHFDHYREQQQPTSKEGKMPNIKERLRRIVFATSVHVNRTIASEKANGFAGTKKFLSGFFWCFVAPLALTVGAKKAHLYSAHKLGIPGDLKQLGVEYEFATSVPPHLRNDTAKTFIRRARIIDFTTTALRILVVLRACRY